jgi:hypothetical protein
METYMETSLIGRWCGQVYFGSISDSLLPSSVDDFSFHFEGNDVLFQLRLQYK